jgi:hypothetical protein
VVLAWAVLLTALTAMLWIWSPGDELAIAVLGGSAAATWLLGVMLTLGSRRAEREPLGRVVPELSPGAALVAIALAAMLLGAEAGLWLVLAGGGLLVFGLAVLARELRTGRTRS